MIEKKSQKLQQQTQQIQVHIQLSPTLYSQISLPFFLGNNPTFYRKNSSNWNDPRIKSFQPTLFTNRRILDIGCNQGVITLLIAMKFFPTTIHGVDIDSKNIQKAKANLKKFIEKNEHFQQKPEQKQIITNISQLPMFFQQKFYKQQSNHCKLTLTSQTKLFPSKGQKNLLSNAFPQNIAFAVENIYSMKGIQIYDTILCLKVTKWVHLAFGDDAIILLFQKISSLLKKGGILILQCQNWKSYKKKKNVNEVHSSTFEKIKYRPDQFMNILQGFSLLHIGTLSNPQLKYPIKLYQKKQ